MAAGMGVFVWEQKVSGRPDFQEEVGLDKRLARAGRDWSKFFCENG